MSHLPGLWHTEQQKPSKTQRQQTNLRYPTGTANPFKHHVKINISIEKCATARSHSRPSPGLRQGPVSSDLHFGKWNPRQSLRAQGHGGKRNFQELPALARLFCAVTCLSATDIPIVCIPDSYNYQHKQFFLRGPVPAEQPDPRKACK